MTRRCREKVKMARYAEFLFPLLSLMVIAESYSALLTFPPFPSLSHCLSLLASCFAFDVSAVHLSIAYTLSPCKAK